MVELQALKNYRTSTTETLVSAASPLTRVVPLDPLSNNPHYPVLWAGTALEDSCIASPEVSSGTCQEHASLWVPRE